MNRRSFMIALGLSPLVAVPALAAARTKPKSIKEKFLALCVEAGLITSDEAREIAVTPNHPKWRKLPAYYRV